MMPIHCPLNLFASLPTPGTVDRWHTLFCVFLPQKHAIRDDWRTTSRSVTGTAAATIRLAAVPRDSTFFPFNFTPQCLAFSTPWLVKARASLLRGRCPKASPRTFFLFASNAFTRAPPARGKGGRIPGGRHPSPGHGQRGRGGGDGYNRDGAQGCEYRRVSSQAPKGPPAVAYRCILGGCQTPVGRLHAPVCPPRNTSKIMRKLQLV